MTRAADSPLGRFLGAPGDPVRCRVLDRYVSIHWWEPGAPFCQCGAEPRDEQPTESEAQP